MLEWINRSEWKYDKQQKHKAKHIPSVEGKGGHRGNRRWKYFSCFCFSLLFFPFSETCSRKDSSKIYIFDSTCQRHGHHLSSSDQRLSAFKSIFIGVIVTIIITNITNDNIFNLSYYTCNLWVWKLNISNHVLYFSVEELLFVFLCFSKLCRHVLILTRHWITKTMSWELWWYP